MTCLHPDACRKKPDPRAKLCRGCTISIRMSKPEAIEQFKARMKRADTRLSWLPDEHREIYTKMRDGEWTAAEAKAEVLSWGRKSA